MGTLGGKGLMQFYCYWTGILQHRSARCPQSQLCDSWIRMHRALFRYLPAFRQAQHLFSSKNYIKRRNKGL